MMYMSQAWNFSQSFILSPVLSSHKARISRKPRKENSRTPGPTRTLHLERLNTFRRDRRWAHKRPLGFLTEDRDLRPHPTQREHVWSPQLSAVNFVLTEAFTMPVLLHAPLLLSPLLSLSYFSFSFAHLLINSKEIQ